MMDLPHITTGRIACKRTLGRVGLAAAVLLATVIVGAGSAVAVPSNSDPIATNPNETVAGPTMEATGGSSFAGSSPTGSVSVPMEPKVKTDPQIDVVEVTEERIVVRVRASTEVPWPSADDVYLGSVDEFEISEDGAAVSVPEDTDGLATPFEIERVDEKTYRMHFRTEEFILDSMGDSEELTLERNDVTERSLPQHIWKDSRDTGSSKYWSGILGSIIVPGEDDVHTPIAMGWGLGVNQ